MTILSISCNWYVVCSRFFYWRQELHLDNLLDTHNIYFGRIENFLEGSEVTEVQFFIKKATFWHTLRFQKTPSISHFSKVFHVSCNIFRLVRFEHFYVSLPLRTNLIQHFRYPQNVFWMCREFLEGSETTFPLNEKIIFCFLELQVCVIYLAFHPWIYLLCSWIYLQTQDY